MARKKEKKKDAKKFRIELRNSGWEKDFQSNDTLGPHMLYLYRPLRVVL
jgi:hypothetical protein